MAPMLPPVLSLDTTRLAIVIDGESHLLKKPGHFSLLENDQAWEEFQTIGKFLQAKHKSPAQRRVAQQRLEVLCRQVLDAPPSVHEALDDLQRVEIVTCFFQHLTRRMGIAAAAQNGTSPMGSPNGSRGSSAGSRGSTGARPGTGTPRSPRG